MRTWIVIAALAALSACGTQPASRMTLLQSPPARVASTERPTPVPPVQTPEREATVADVTERTTYELELLDRMIYHHRFAVARANEAVARARTPKVQAMARQILAEQPAEIDRLLALRAQWYPQVELVFNHPGTRPVPVPANERQFVDTMVVHYEQGEALFANAIQHARHAELRAIAAERRAKEQQERATLL